MSLIESGPVFTGGQDLWVKRHWSTCCFLCLPWYEGWVDLLCRNGPGHCPTSLSTSLVNAASRLVVSHLTLQIYSSCFFSFLQELLLCSHPEGDNFYLIGAIVTGWGGGYEAPRGLQARALCFIVASQVLCIGVCIWYTLSCLVGICKYPIPPLPLNLVRIMFYSLFCLFVCSNTVW